jgi:hypothetical protein
MFAVATGNASVRLNVGGYFLQLGDARLREIDIPLVRLRERQRVIGGALRGGRVRRRAVGSGLDSGNLLSVGGDAPVESAHRSLHVFDARGQVSDLVAVVHHLVVRVQQSLVNLAHRAVVLVAKVGLVGRDVQIQAVVRSII